MPATVSHCVIHNKKGKSPLFMSFPVTNDGGQLDFEGLEGSTKQVMKGVQTARRDRVATGSGK